MPLTFFRFPLAISKLRIVCLVCLSTSSIAHPVSNNSTVGHHYSDSLIKNTDWLSSFDLDGDSINDKIDFEFTGGGHCCYKISITLSSDKKVRKFPFEMDGGYVGGVDNSKPNQFDIRDVDQDGLPEIFMLIETYNGKWYPIPGKWRRKYGIRSNRILIEFNENQLQVRDQ